MKEYIEKEKLFDCLDIKNALGGHYGISLTAINAIPAADVVEVRHGKWIEENTRLRSSQFCCSVCHRTAYDPQPTRLKDWKKRCRYAYCPNCGARMDGGAEC